MPGIHLCEPSPQRTPVLYQAGASSRGKQFAAGHAECVFVAAPSKVLLKKTVADIRRRAAEAGRDPHSILIFNLQTVIVGDTDREAQAKWQEYKQYVSYEGALALLSGWTGIDFGQYQPDQVLKYLHTNAIQSAVEAFSTADPNRQWTVQALADWAGIGGFGPLVVGSAQTVADELQSWVEETDVDGFNLAYAVTHETFRDVVELLVPELQKRGVFKQEYREGPCAKTVRRGPSGRASPGRQLPPRCAHGIGRGEGDMIAIDDLHKSYRTADGRLSAVLKGLSLQVPERSITAVVGPSGAGKSTWRCITCGRTGQRQHSYQWPGSVGAVRRGAAPGTAGDWHRFPVFGAVEPQDRLGECRPAAGVAWCGGARYQGAGWRAAGERRPQPQSGCLAGPALRRPAPADRHCPRADAAPVRSAGG